MQEGTCAAAEALTVQIHSWRSTRLSGRHALEWGYFVPLGSLKGGGPALNRARGLWNILTDVVPSMQGSSMSWGWPAIPSLM